MGPSLTVYVLDKTTDERLTSFDVRLNPIGVPGEFRSTANEDGSHTFSNIPAGNYSLAVYDPQDRYAPLYQRIAFGITENNPINVRVTSGAFISGQILDEERRPPEHCFITLLKHGDRLGKIGYVNHFGDLPVAEQGQFRSPPLYPGRYILRVHGMLQAADNPPHTSPYDLRHRFFDFLYPNARTLDDATVFDIAAGEIRSGLQVQIPRPAWHTVRGKVIGNLPEEMLVDLAEDRPHLSVMFAWDCGAVDQVGGSGGVRLQEDGTFETTLQPGRYTVEVCEFSPPQPSSRIHLLQSFGKTTVDVPDHDLNGVEIVASAGE